jgi:hypothetical protein
MKWMSSLYHKFPVTIVRTCGTRLTCLSCLCCSFTIVTGDLWYKVDMPFVSLLLIYDCHGWLVVQGWHAINEDTKCMSSWYHKSPVTIVCRQWRHEMHVILVPQVSRYNRKSAIKTRKACQPCTTSFPLPVVSRKKYILFINKKSIVTDVRHLKCHALFQIKSQPKVFIDVIKTIATIYFTSTITTLKQFYCDFWNCQEKQIKFIIYQKLKYFFFKGAISHWESRRQNSINSINNSDRSKYTSKSHD